MYFFFREVINCSAYYTSAFITMVENELVKTETIETILADSKAQKKILENIEEKLDK